MGGLHELVEIRRGEDKLRTGLCRCGWMSAGYALSATVRRSHKTHLETVAVRS